ncbi:hypothetical protein E2C01_028218 [Portunus trituberculatus]|uniref:Uncharacterized protein n=1 Tax=Portunus trituberculatus TaxID=210409 RepID=A0A5B7ENL6_PORTR|nr:hypothetical protein [Portunus trituberculatus]
MSQVAKIVLMATDERLRGKDEETVNRAQFGFRKGLLKINRASQKSGTKFNVKSQEFGNTEAGREFQSSLLTKG